MGKDNFLVSIIVPIYNSERFLSDCVESILSQTYKNIEVILVNDGSTDNSLEICYKYEDRDERVKVINQKNAGPSAARNRGIQEAKGDFIQFVDSDDKIDRNMTEILMSTMHQDSDLIICGYKIVRKMKNEMMVQNKIPPVTGLLSSDEFINHFSKFFNNTLINSIWNKLYHKRIIRDYNIGFEVGINSGEDLIFNLKYLKYCKKLKAIKDPLYNYIKYNNNQSLTQIYIENLLESRKKIFFELRKYIINKDENVCNHEKFFRKCYSRFIKHCLTNIYNNNNFVKKSRWKEIERIVSDAWVRENIDKFYKETIQDYFISFMIRNELIKGIDYFFVFKHILRNSMAPLFSSLRSINRRVRIKDD